MKFPFEKYHYAVKPAKLNDDGECIQGPIVFAFTTYAGATVKGCAKCTPHDYENGLYNEEIGKRLAAVRCGQKVMVKKAKSAERAMANSKARFVQAYNDHVNAIQFAQDVQNEWEEYEDFLADILCEINN